MNETVPCPVCKGTKIAPSGNRCGCCDGKGCITKEQAVVKSKIKKDLTRRYLGLESAGTEIVKALLDADEEETPFRE